MSRQRVAVIDYGMGNLRSVSKAIEHVAPDADVVVSDDANTILSADRIVCPGQGAARDCMAALAQSDLDQVVVQGMASRPFLGICMGCQVLLTRSEENGGVDCLDVVPGVARRFDSPLLDDNGERLKIPHMGWSEVMHTRDHPLWQDIPDGARFYFAHSYYCDIQDEAAVAGRAVYGRNIPVAAGGEGWFACQFHPEKSAQDGLQLLKNFVSWNGTC
jgi:glutamine amidotransferase